MARSEDIPPLDLVADWPVPEEQDRWYGDSAVETQVLRAFTSGRMHHALLIGGPKGVGKATLAFRIARFVLANPEPRSADAGSLDVSSDHRVFRQVAAGAHPNLLVLRRPWDEQAKRYRTEVTVGEVRRIQSFFGSTAGEPGWRVCIVDTADELNTSAANALLKMLEEPPSNGLFILVTNRPGQLLPTIRSRCHRIDLKPLPVDELQSALATGMPEASAAERDLAAQLAGGSLRRAIEFLQEEGGGTYQQFAKLTQTLPEVDYAGVHALADRVAIRGRDDAFDAFVGVVEDWLSRRVRNESEPAAPLPQPVQAASLASWADVWEKVRDTTLQAETLNLDRRQVVLQVFMALATATRM